MPVEETIAKARAAALDGDKYRAKEILRSSLGTYGFCPSLYKAYAELLLEMDDKLQAGRYFFFSVTELEDSQQQPVELFLKRHANEGYKSLLAAAPKAEIRRLSDLPKFAQDTLRTLGAPEDLKPSTPPKMWSAVGCLLVAVLVLIGLVIIGLITVVKWLNTVVF